MRPIWYDCLKQRQRRHGPLRLKDIRQELLYTPLFFEFHGGAVANLRKLVDLVIVDVGGLCQQEKQPVQEQCAHYIVVSRGPDRISE